MTVLITNIDEPEKKRSNKAAASVDNNIPYILVYKMKF